MRVIKKICYALFDGLAAVLTAILLPVLWAARRFGVEHFPLQSSLFKIFGVFPIRDHYYEPRFNYPADVDLSATRTLPLELDLDGQLSELGLMAKNMGLNELKMGQDLIHAGSSTEMEEKLLRKSRSNFCGADADLYFLMIRHFRPRKIIEVGSGFSTIVAMEALGLKDEVKENGVKDDGLKYAGVKENGSLMVHDAELICIEPFEMPFLENLAAIRLIRQPVEEVDLAIFDELGPNDILFIDSSHIIRPGNDLLHLMFEVLPRLKKGVIIHFHDIFTPYHYPPDWLQKKMRFWNEQYLLEAFLYNNADFKVLFALHALSRKHSDALSQCLPDYRPDEAPSSFWLKRL